jgi:hypothetical protein
MLACAHPAFDGSVILFQDIIEILHGTVLRVLLQSSLGLELHDGRRITGVIVGIDYPRGVVILCAKRFGSQSAEPLLPRG